MNWKRVLTAIGAAVMVTAAMAQSNTTGTITQTMNFPLAGLGSSEIALLNVVNVATASASGTAASCVGTIAFFSSTGTIIGSATSFTLGTQKAASMTLPFASSGATGKHTLIRGVVTLTQTLGSGVPCSLETTFETYDSTLGDTHIHLDQAATETNYGGGPGRRM